MLREEIFGPVLGISTFSDEDEAVRLANGTEYGLVSYVFTESLARGHRMIERLETGMMGLNVGVVSNAAAPFGGVKQSGIGREGGLEGIHEYLSTKYTLDPRLLAVAGRAGREPSVRRVGRERSEQPYRDHIDRPAHPQLISIRVRLRRALLDQRNEGTHAPCRRSNATSS